MIKIEDDAKGRLTDSEKSWAQGEPKTTQKYEALGLGGLEKGLNPSTPTCQSMVQSLYK